MVHASDTKMQLFSYYPCHQCRGVRVDSQGRWAIGTISIWWVEEEKRREKLISTRNSSPSEERPAPPGWRIATYYQAAREDGGTCMTSCQSKMTGWGRRSALSRAHVCLPPGRRPESAAQA